MWIISESPEATEELGVSLAHHLLPGDFIALHGDLGAGKTRLAGGIVRGLGVDQAVPVTSPTYTLLNIYQGRIPLYHFDLYRLQGDDDVVELGFTDYFAGEGISLVEWPERLQAELPPDRLEIFMEYIDANVRKIELVAVAARYERLIEQLPYGDKN